MARARNRRSRQNRSNANPQSILSQYGYPSNRVLQARAAALAQASLPTVRSVRQPFEQSMGDVRGYSDAAVALERELGPATAAAYQQALSQQQQIDSAAQQRLGELGTPGVAASQGGLSDSAYSRLNAESAAAQAYQAQQPGIVTSRGQLAQQGLEKSLQDALQQRRDQFRSGFVNAYQQERSNAQALSLSLMQSAQQQRQFEQSYNLQLQQFNEGIHEFNVSQKNALARASGTGALSQKDLMSALGAAADFLNPKADTVNVPHYGKVDTGRTDSNGDPIYTYQIDGYNKVQLGGGATGANYAQQGIHFDQAISDLVSRGIVPNKDIAALAAQSVYAKARGSKFGTPAFSAYATYVHWMMQNFPKQAQWKRQWASIQQKIRTGQLTQSIFGPPQGPFGSGP